jgi:hypothetical protein
MNIKYNIDTVKTVMDNVDIEDYDIFECSICGERKCLTSDVSNTMSDTIMFVRNVVKNVDTI